MSPHLISWFLSMTNSWMEKVLVSSGKGPDLGGCVSSCWRENDGQQKKKQKHTASRLRLRVGGRTCSHSDVWSSPSSSSPDSSQATVSSGLVCLCRTSSSLSSKSHSHVRSTSEVTLRKPTMLPSLCGETRRQSSSSPALLVFLSPRLFDAFQRNFNHKTALLDQFDSIWVAKGRRSRSLNG